MNSTATTTRQALTSHVASGSTATLATCLIALDDMPATNANRVAGADVIEELARRFPEIVPALDAWSNDLETDLSIIEATVAAIPLEAL